jgi:hypothetical protein
MRFTLSLLAASALVLTGCASYEKPVPEGYSGPVATVADSGQVQSSRLVHIFELTQVDGRRLQGSHLATLQANQGRGFSQTPAILSNQVPARELRVRLEAATVYAAPILAMTNPTCMVKGEVQFKAEPEKRYRVTGALTPEQCAVWIEDASTGAVVTEKVVAKGTH